MDTTENNKEPSYLESNWTFDPVADLDYDNKFFKIIFDSSIDPSKIESSWYLPLKEFAEKDGKSKIMRPFPDPLVIGFFLEDSSREYLHSLFNEFKSLNIPEDVLIKCYKNPEDYKEFKDLSEFEMYIQSL